jgi:uroporphyrinogen-III synthase
MGLIDAAQKALKPATGPLLYPSAADVAGNLVAGLSAAGFKVDRHIVYRMDLAERLSGEAEDALRHGALDLVTYFSVRSVHGTRQAAETSGLRDRLDRVAALCLSPAVAAIAKQSHKRTLSASAATEAGMLQALDLARRSGL